MFLHECKTSSFHSRVLSAQFMAIVLTHNVYQILKELENHFNPSLHVLAFIKLLI